MTIRYAGKEDCAAIAGIYNHAVVNTAAIWNDQTVDVENRIAGLKRVLCSAIRCWLAKKTV